MTKKRSRSEQEAYDIEYVNVFNGLYHNSELELAEVIESLRETCKKLTEYRNRRLTKEAKRIVDEES